VAALIDPLSGAYPAAFRHFNPLPSMRVRTGQLTLLSLLSVIACSHGDQPVATGNNGGTMVIAVGGDADNLLPPLTVSDVATEVGSLIYERLAEPGMDLNTIGDAGFEPRLASTWKWAPDSMSLSFALNPAAHWQDGRPVTARDVRFTFSLYTDSTVGSALAPLVSNIDSVTVGDSLTAVFWFHRRTPEQFYDAACQMRILPEHVLARIPRADLKTSPVTREPVGSGPYRLVRWTPGTSLDLAVDTTWYRGRGHLDRIIFSIVPEPQTMILRLWSGEADLMEYLRPADLADLPKHPTLRTLRLPRMEYSQVLFNERDPKNLSQPNPIFGDREVRRALAMAVNRRAIIHTVFNDSLGYVALGPVTHALATFDSTIPQLPYAPDSAAKLLDARGWRMGASGVREKNGRPLRFSLIVPTSSTLRGQSAVLIQDMLKQVGVAMDIEQLEFPTHLHRSQAHQFDATFVTTGLDPTPSSIRQAWTTAAAQRVDGTNYGLHSSPPLDALIDSAVTERDRTRALSLYRRAYAMLVADAPGIFIYEPITVMALHRRLRPERVRVDAWYANLAEWWIPPDERISRDRTLLAEQQR